MTVIVVSGQRTAALEQQFAQFVHDPEIARVDLIYVVEPADAREEFDAAGRLFDLYRVPFRMICCRSGGMFAAAFDAAAAAARSPLLVMLEPEALPDCPGSFGRLAAFYRSKPDAGAVGPRILNADGSIQHPREVDTLGAACLMIERNRLQQVGGLRGAYIRADAETIDLCRRLAEAGYHNWGCPDVAVYSLASEPAGDGERAPAILYDEWLRRRLWGVR